MNAKQQQIMSMNYDTLSCNYTHLSYKFHIIESFIISSSVEQNNSFCVARFFFIFFFSCIFYSFIHSFWKGFVKQFKLLNVRAASSSSSFFCLFLIAETWKLYDRNIKSMNRIQQQQKEKKLFVKYFYRNFITLQKHSSDVNKFWVFSSTIRFIE